MPYKTLCEIEEAERVKRIAIAIALVVIGTMTVVMMLLTAPPRLTADDDMPTYDYAGPDGTLMGVPYELRNYVVEDHDTGVYYFLIVNPETGSVTICPRYNADGTLWTMPRYEEGQNEES